MEQKKGDKEGRSVFSRVFSSAPSREKRKSRCAEIRSEEKEAKVDSRRTKKRPKGEADEGTAEIASRS
ncbi:hypothetical protein ALC62_08755 [Cyphomyrmex costatus]|uniref:Uncharacterized protein n=1 Tax=Cyphomyrmex costatus TaxID=456900 RepID=A0A195CI96_9HYME|nr:hypothetical protein ALC62_08755 [Cyphomyrmex costatus]